MAKRLKIEDVARLALDTANTLNAIGPGAVAQQLVLRALIDALTEADPAFLARFDDALCRHMDGKSPELIGAVTAFLGVGDAEQISEAQSEDDSVITLH